MWGQDGSSARTRRRAAGATQCQSSRVVWAAFSAASEHQTFVSQRPLTPEAGLLRQQLYPAPRHSVLLSPPKYVTEVKRQGSTSPTRLGAAAVVRIHASCYFIGLELLLYRSRVVLCAACVKPQQHLPPLDGTAAIGKLTAGLKVNTPAQTVWYIQ